MTLRLTLRFLLCTALVSACTTSGDHFPYETTIAIHDNYFSGKAELTRTSRGFKIALLNARGEKSDQAIFNYQPYQLDTADVNRDGRTDIIVGLIKSTEFDPEEKKRLFILQIDEGQLRPLWLGSKVCQQLIDFKAMTNGVVRTLEKTNTGNYAIGHYEWQGFGLTLLEYASNEKPYDEAITLFRSKLHSAL